MINLTEEEMAAELLVRQLQRSRMVNTAWRKNNVACYTTKKAGHHLMNEMHDFDCEVHLVCETSKLTKRNNVPDDIPEDEHGKIFVNILVRGINEDYNGHGLPTHISGMAGAKPKSENDMDYDLIHMAMELGIDLEN